MPKIIAILIGSSLVGLALAISLIVGLGWNKPLKSGTSTETVQTAPTATIDEALDAIIRAHPRVKKVCYDTGYDGYFVLFPPLADESKRSTDWFDWYLLQKTVFYQASNKTWFITDQNEKNYVRVYPDVKGLQCKDV